MNVQVKMKENLMNDFGVSFRFHFSLGDSNVEKTRFFNIADHAKK